MGDLIQKILAFISDPQSDYSTHTADFLKMCVLSILLSLLIALPVGILVAGRPRLAAVAESISGLGRAIPTIVFLAAILPILGTGLAPTVAALTVLGIPPILLNTVAGLRGIDPAAVDAGRGMGMTWSQLLFRVRMPLVLPVVAAGVRTSAVQIVATAPLGALIGAGGYGDYILNGIFLFDTAQALAGAVPVAILALVAEQGLGALQRAITPVGVRTRRTPTSVSTVAEPAARRATAA